MLLKPVRRWGVCVLLPLMLGACRLPSGMFERPPENSPEAAAEKAMAQIETAELNGAKVPRWRFQNIVRDYPGTRPAYEANLILARMDFRRLDTQRKSSTSKENVLPGFREFVETYAFGTHAQPPDADLARQYEFELHPFLLDALLYIGELPLMYQYIGTFPNLETTTSVRKAVEQRLVDPEFKWEAVRWHELYASIDPPSPNLDAILDQIQQNLVRYIDRQGVRKDCDRFLEQFPDSPYREEVERLRRFKTI